MASQYKTTTPGLMLAHAFAIIVIATIVRAALEFENAEEALAFYGVYHREPWNQFIHFFGVPGILWSILVFLVHLKVPFVGELPMVQKLLLGYGLTYGLLLSLFYAVFYLQIDSIGGILYAPFLYIMFASSVYWMQQDQKKAAAVGNKSWNGTGRLLWIAFVVHIFSWYIQIHPGHRIIEGAQPASLQSLGGALTVAPLFAFYEGLWLLGINKELQTITLQLVDQYTRELCSSGTVAMRVCQNLAPL
jgi:uncharacterized membrane protein YGL010W